ncbi:MAG: pyridoxal 5'-phosphate synthase glutaminase subunit PdxT [Candidatus Dormibacteria bacterium]
MVAATPPIPSVGVLALQGAFREHLVALRAAGADAFEVRSADELDRAEGLVLPGGESTTMDKLMRKFDLQRPLRERIIAGMPVFATCAGLILLADEVVDGLPDQETLGVLPLRVRRNGYGRQPDSFEEPLDIRGLDDPFPGVFIRAPMIEAVGPGLEVLATVGGRPVAVRHQGVLGLTFHPELSGDHRLHRLFIDELSGQDRRQATG